MRAGELREAFNSFWAERGHDVRASASLIPHEPSLLFTVAGMVPFMPYFLGEEVPPTRRMVTIQKCVRAGGKHNDLDDIGRTNRHFTFFEMMGNFSFGDYFKAEAIPWAWEFVTEVLGLEREKLWVTVHVSDDEAAEIWQSSVGVPPERIQRLDKDNWWAAGDVGPCGPCSEIFYTTAMLISDGVFPSNEDRGYVLRRIIRRAVRHAWVLGVTDVVMPRLVEIVVDVMGDHYTDLVKNRQFIADVVAREEERFRTTLAAGQKILDEATAGLDSTVFNGEVAFLLHDTHGFPVEVTEEILTERGLSLDRDGFEAAMERQRERARAGRAGGPTFADERYREILAQFGPTDFVRDASTVADARVLATFDIPPDGGQDSDDLGGDLVEVFLDRTPFYAESGGQIGDIGTITGPDGSIEVLDCAYALADLHRHIGRVVPPLRDLDEPRASHRRYRLLRRQVRRRGAGTRGRRALD